MGKSLVVVESPAKARTINQYLGKDFKVLATVGHIIDLPKSTIGVDIKNDFQPKYVIIPGKEKVVSQLKKAAKDATDVYIATDPDREGEAIAWHIATEIKGSNGNIHRVLFNEITKRSVKEGIANPGIIDNFKVDAQQARRVMDRLVGYKVSPFLWKAITFGLSAGRVQSVALRLICEREIEIEDFIQEEYWSITAKLKTRSKDLITAELIQINGKKIEIPNEKTANIHLDNLSNKTFTISDIRLRTVRRKPSPPFTTSTLQQDASRRFGFSTKQIMVIAQQLYEGIEIGKEGSVGLITYMRTDSTRIGKEALEEVRNYILEGYGKEYVSPKPVQYRAGKRAQDAHEAIRPTSAKRSPKAVRKYLSTQQYKIYELIWNRFVACQMSPAVFDLKTVDITADEYLFRAIGSVVKFLGFLQVYEESVDDKENSKQESSIPKGIKKKDILKLIELIPGQHFTKPPPRFNESALVKELDRLGIGRPSTYAVIISNILSRNYVEKQMRNLVPTELGKTVNKVLTGNFPDIFNVKFTSLMEDELDRIESCKKKSKRVLDEFYKPFSKSLEQVTARTDEIKKALEQETEEICEKCGKPMIIKIGRHGQFYACSGYPECKNTRPFNTKEAVTEQKTEETCEKCGKPMVIKAGRHGQFYACSGYPECKNTRSLNAQKPEPVDEKCPECGSQLVKRTGRYGPFLSCSNYPKCKYNRPLGIGVPCPNEGCNGEIVQLKGKKGKVFYGCINYPECKFQSWHKPVAHTCPKCSAPYLEERYSKNKGLQWVCPKCKAPMEPEDSSFK